MKARTEPVPVEPKNGSLPEGTPKQLKNRPEIVAWFVLLASFAVFCFLAWWLVGLVSNFLSNTVQPQTAQLALQSNYTFILHPGQNHEVQVYNGDFLHEGDVVHTDKDGQADLNLFDGSSIHLYPGTRLVFQQLRVTGFGRTHKDVVFMVNSGVVRIKMAAHKAEDIIQAGTDDGAAINFSDLSGGSYRIELERNSDGTSRTWISNYSSEGAIKVSANGSAEQPLEAGQQLLVVKGEAPSPPDNLGVELINNGAFLDGLDGWQTGYDQGSDGGKTNGLVIADSELLGDETKTRVHFSRYGGDASQNHAEVRLTQNIDKYVADYEHLNLELYVKLKYQSLQGGGALGSEYPLAVEIYYNDANGDEKHFFYGFYYINSDPNNQTYDNASDPLLHSQEIRNNIWEHFTLDLMQLPQKPSQISRIVISASGHEFESYCTNLSLRAS